jgi:hypothetical protein
MFPERDLSASLSSTTCYFTYIPSPATHFSVETPLTPLGAYTPDISPDPLNPLLAFRQPSLEYLSPPSMDASKLLQLQTAAAHSRPSATPLQQIGIMSSTSSSNSSQSSLQSPSTTIPTLSWCCARCRRTCYSADHVVQFGTNLFYCSHCASMTGYAVG